MNLEEVKSLVTKLYNINGKAQKLPGEADLNYEITELDRDSKYTLKISRDDSQEDWIDLQAKTLQFLEHKDLAFAIPSVVETIKGKSYTRQKLSDGKLHYVRLQRWVLGNVLAKANPINTTLLNQLGTIAGSLSQGLSGFDHPWAHKPFNWNSAQLLDYQTYLQYLSSEAQKEIVNYFFKGFSSNQATIDQLRKSVCYNDLNDYNILTSWKNNEHQISGIIDFGDITYTQTVNELAIACAYACMHFPDPLRAATDIVKGYHKIFSLEDNEIKVLFYLIAARLIISVCRSAYNKSREPENKYLLISEKPAWDLLKKWRKISSDFAYYSFRAACGLEAHPKVGEFSQWLNKNKSQLIAPINISNKTAAWIDLSVASLELGNNSNFKSLSSFNDTIQRILRSKNAQIGLGGYGEIRPFYSTNNYRVEGNQGDKYRTVHLGLDIWSAEFTPVYAPLDGTVYATANHSQSRDYGGLLILKHTISDKLAFYTLYGHLSWSSIKHLNQGDFIKSGDQLAVLGSSKENGEWPPHLHFQVMLDMLNWNNDFPGVAFPDEASVWKSICPYIEFYHGTPVTKEIKSQEIISRRAGSLGKNLSLSYQPPIQMVRGFKQYLYDSYGQPYLDTVNNVAHVGHEHPRVVRAGQSQMGVLNTNTRYLHQNIIEYSERLLSMFPDSLSVCYLVNSGSEANELALRMARAQNGSKDMLAIQVGYHGNTGNTIDVSSYKFDQQGGDGKPEFTHLLPIPDTYRGEHKDPLDAGVKYAAYADDIINELEKHGTPIAGFIAESILSCGGQIMLPKNYLTEIYQKVRAAGGICIADEVQVGFGRVGIHFWGYELSEVIPDIVTLGKPIGNGHPLAAVVCTQRVADSFNNGMEYFNTFGGNPVSCAIGLEVLRVIEEEQLQTKALALGDYLKTKLLSLQKVFPIIGDVRGQGLFLGFELVKDLKTLEPANQEATYLINRMRSLGILMSTDGPYHNVIKIKPPMCITQDDVDYLIVKLKEVLKELDNFK